MTTPSPTDPPLRPVPPGRYRDFLPAGEGGMGIVYWALDTELNRQVAFKVMRPDPGAGGAAGVTPPAPLQLASPPPGADPAFEALKHPDTMFLPIPEPFVQGAEGFALRKGDPDALNFFNNWILLRQQDGWLKERHDYWFKTRDWAGQVVE